MDGPSPTDAPAALLLALSLGQPSANAASFTDPVKPVKGADPRISYHDGNCHPVTTSWTDVITIRKPSTPAGLATAPGVQVRKGDAASRCRTIWAPELHFLNGRWYLYHVAGQNVSDCHPTQRSHVLESAGSGSSTWPPARWPTSRTAPPRTVPTYGGGPG
ncbi:hypothetical protein SUDANB58_01697 [Streptomyces sp. enrichment culture]